MSLLTIVTGIAVIFALPAVLNRLFSLVQEVPDGVTNQKARDADPDQRPRIEEVIVQSDKGRQEHEDYSNMLRDSACQHDQRPVSVWPKVRWGNRQIGWRIVRDSLRYDGKRAESMEGGVHT